MEIFSIRRATIAAMVLLASSPAMAWVRPASVLQSGMVLQRGMQVPVWGTAGSGERVKVYFGGQMKVAFAGKDSHWMVKLDPLTASGVPRRLGIVGKDTVTLDDVVVGEVWLASGQSNMQYTFRPDLYPDEAATADRPLLRTINVSGAGASTAADETGGTWVPCTPETVSQFSAVGFFFAAKLQDELKVPLGVINASWGGTPIEAWTSLGALTADAKLAAVAQAQVAAMASRPQDELRFDAANEAWEQRYGYADLGNKGYELGWAEPDFDTTGWAAARASPWTSDGRWTPSTATGTACPLAPPPSHTMATRDGCGSMGARWWRGATWWRSDWYHTRRPMASGLRQTPGGTRWR